MIIITNIKLFELISKEYIGSKEIRMIVGCGINKAQQIRQEIEQECKEKDILLFTNKIPTEMLLKKIGISIKKIHDKAKMEKLTKTFITITLTIVILTILMIILGVL